MWSSPSKRQRFKGSSALAYEYCCERQTLHSTLVWSVSSVGLECLRRTLRHDYSPRRRNSAMARDLRAWRRCRLACPAQSHRDHRFATVPPRRSCQPLARGGETRRQHRLKLGNAFAKREYAAIRSVGYFALLRAMRFWASSIAATSRRSFQSACSGSLPALRSPRSSDRAGPDRAG
jgi:hypothetical protein